MEFLLFQAICIAVVSVALVILLMYIEEYGLCIIRRRCKPSLFICIVLVAGVITLFIMISEHLYNSNKVTMSVNKYPIISNGVVIGRHSQYIVYDYNGEIVSRSVSGDEVKYTSDRSYIEITSSKAGIFKKKFDNVLIYLNKGE